MPKQRSFEESQIEWSLMAKRSDKKIPDGELRDDLRQGTDGARELASESIKSDAALFKLFTELAFRYRFRDGGYTRVIASRQRKGDAAQLAFIE